MEDINIVIKRVLNFVQIVQQYCDQHRQTLELHFKSELTNHARELIQKEDSQEEDSSVPEVIDVAKDESTDSEAETLEKADKLLKKARYIRNKYKIEDLVFGYSNEDRVPSANSFQDLEKCVTACKVRQSHSAPLMNRSGAKNTRAEPCSRGEEFSRTSRSPSDSNIPVRTRNTNTKDSIDKSDGVVVASRGLCKTIKNLKIDGISNKSVKNATTASSKAKNFPVPKYRVKKPPIASVNHREYNNKSLRTKLSNVKSVYASSTSAQKRQTSIRQVLRDSNGKSFENGVGKSNFLPYFWYPFIISENKTRLITHITCRNQNEFKRILVLLYKIQEAMYWIDLFSLIGRDVVAPLQSLDQRDQKVSLIISYIQGFFHKNLQRIPVIVQSTCTKVLTYEESNVPKNS